MTVRATMPATTARHSPAYASGYWERDGAGYDARHNCRSEIFSGHADKALGS